jgi:hypothetical protein
MKIGIVGCGMPTLTQNDHVASLQRPAGGSLRVLRLPQMTWGSSEIAATVRKKEPTHQESGPKPASRACVGTARRPGIC